MIVRILGEGQLDVPESALDALNALDTTLQNAVDANDADAFDTALGELLAKVREVGKTLPDDHLEPSELVLPSADASLAEVKELLSEEGLIPG
ncbi:MAG: PspA-associated protein PspAA [Mycobacteriales bacterium]